MLHVAALYGLSDAAQALLKDGAGADVKNSDGYTALHLAAKKGHVNIVKALLDKGANPSLKGSDNKTPIELAKDKDVKELLKQAQSQKATNKADATFESNNSSQNAHPESPQAVDHKNVIQPLTGNNVENKQITTKTMAVGIALGVIAASAVVAGLVFAEVALPVLAVIGIAVAAGLAVGVVAGGITYAVSKPNNELSGTNVDALRGSEVPTFGGSDTAR